MARLDDFLLAYCDVVEDDLWEVMKAQSMLRAVSELPPMRSGDTTSYSKSEYKSFRPSLPSPVFVLRNGQT